MAHLVEMLQRPNKVNSRSTKGLELVNSVVSIRILLKQTFTSSAEFPRSYKLSARAWASFVWMPDAFPASAENFAITC